MDCLRVDGLVPFSRVNRLKSLVCTALVPRYSASVAKMSSTSGLLGVVVIARHGDREGFYQDPLTYTASETSITPLGDVRYRTTHLRSSRN